MSSVEGVLNKTNVKFLSHVAFKDPLSQYIAKEIFHAAKCTSFIIVPSITNTLSDLPYAFFQINFLLLTGHIFKSQATATTVTLGGISQSI